MDHIKTVSYSKFLEVRVVEVHEGVLKPSDLSANLLNINSIRNFTSLEAICPPHIGVAEGVHDGLEDRFQEKGVAIYTISIHKKNS